jgi:hypothetical protein
MVLLSPSRRILRLYPEIAHDRFLSSYFYSISHLVVQHYYVCSYFQPFIRQCLYSALLDPGLFFCFVIIFTQSAVLRGRGISPSQGHYIAKWLKYFLWQPKNQSGCEAITLQSWVASSTLSCLLLNRIVEFSRVPHVMRVSSGAHELR